MPQGHDFEIQNADGTWFGLSLAPTFDREGNQEPKRFSDLLAASDADAPVSEALASSVKQSWGGGVGIDYDFAPGVYTRSGIWDDDDDEPERLGYACPAGAVTEITVPATAASGPIVAIVQYGSDLFLAQEGTSGNAGRVLRIVSPYTACTQTLILSGAGRYLRGLVVAENGSGGLRLYAMSSDSGLQNGEIHEWDGTNWTPLSGASGTSMGAANGRGPSEKVEWRGQDNIRNNVIFTVSGPRQVAWTRPGLDPRAGTASWVEGVRINTTGQIRAVGGSKGHIYVATDDNVYDIDEVGNTVSLLRYGAIETGNGGALHYLDGSLFYATGDGLLKIDVGRDLLQEDPGQCRPGYLTGAEIPPGYTTALTSSDGWLVNATFDPSSSTRQSLVYWGKARESVKVVNTANPMVWHGPELVVTGDLRVTAMLPASLGSKRLWVAVVDDATNTTPKILWQSLPRSGDPLQDRIAGGAHTFCSDTGSGSIQPYSRIFGLRQSGKDKGSRTDIQAVTIGSTGLGGGTKLVSYVRADPARNSTDGAPGAASWGTGTDITTMPVQTYSPATTNGYAVQQQIRFVSGSTTTPAFLDLLRLTYWKIVPDANVRTVDVVYGDAPDRSNVTPSTHAPDTITGWLEDLMSNGTRTTVRDPSGDRWTVRLRQVFPRETTTNTGGRWKKQVRASLQLVKLAEL